MPWNQAESKFIRTNSIEFSGVNVWQKDQLASIKIIATRHDYHDQDMADGISRCLNIDGYNKMYANLDMNNYSIINLAGGTLPKDVATYDQIFDTMVFDEPSRTLTLSRPNGTSLSEVIPGGTGGGGTVTQINPGTGIAMNPNPITGTGTVSLENLGNPKSASNGIGSITVDTYGRVTAVTGGFGAGYVTDVPQGTGLTYGRTDAGWVAIDTGGGGGSLLTINMDSDSGNITIGGTGNSTIQIPLAGGGNAGLVTDAERQKLGDFPDPGTTVGNYLVWGGSSLGWQENGFLRWDGGQGIQVGGTLRATSSSPNPNYINFEGDVQMQDNLYVGGPGGGGILTAGIALNLDTISNIEFAPTSGQAMTQYVSSGVMRIGAGGSGSISSDRFEFQTSGAQITYLAAIANAKFKGDLEGTVNGITPTSSLLTTTEREAMIDMLETQGVLTAVRAAQVKAEITAAPTPVTGTPD